MERVGDSLPRQSRDGTAQRLAVTADVDMSTHASLNIRQRYGHVGISNWRGKANGLKLRNVRLRELAPFQRPVVNPGAGEVLGHLGEERCRVAVGSGPDLDPGSFAQEDARPRKAGLRPGCISGYKGDDGKMRLAAVWFPKTAGVNTVCVDMTAKEFDELRASNRRQGYRLSWIDVYGDGRDRRYAAIWVNDGQKIEWEDIHGDLKTVDEKTRSLEGYSLLIDCYFEGDTGEPGSAEAFHSSQCRILVVWRLLVPARSNDAVFAVAASGLYQFLQGQAFARLHSDVVRPWLGIVWDFSMSANSSDFQAEMDRKRQQGFRLDMLKAR